MTSNCRSIVSCAGLARTEDNERRGGESEQNPSTSNVIPASEMKAGKLPAEERDVLLLVCVQGMSYRDAVHELGISTVEVKDRLLRARLGLIRTLDL